MKILKSVAVLVVSSAALLACSEGSYVPATTTGQAVTANGTITGTNGVNTTTLQPGQPGYVAPGANVSFTTNGTTNGVANGTLPTVNDGSCASRATPNFYTYYLQNCAVRKQPTNGTPISSNPASNSGTETNPKILPLTITGADAKALYSRLAKAPDQLNNSSKTQVRTGMSYKCMMDGDGKDNKDYACDFDVYVHDGAVSEQFPVADTGVALIANAVGYNGPNLSVGGSGLNPDEGLIKIASKPASYLYSKLNSTATDGITPLSSTIQGQIKLGKEVTCYSVMLANVLNYTCQIKVNIVTGQAEETAANSL